MSIALAISITLNLVLGLWMLRFALCWSMSNKAVPDLTDRLAQYVAEHEEEEKAFRLLRIIK